MAKKKKPAPKKAAKKPAHKQKKVAKAKITARRKKPAPKRKSTALGSPEVSVGNIPLSGRSARSGGQSGDIEGLSDVADADSESVEELLEEGQSFEAEVIHGVENAPDPDESEIVTEEVPEDDVPEEYGGEQ